MSISKQIGVAKNGDWFFYLFRDLCIILDPKPTVNGWMDGMGGWDRDESILQQSRWI